MPAMLDDPAAPTIYRVSGEKPYPQPGDTHLPDNVLPKQVTLRDRITVATLLPCLSPDLLPPGLLSNLCDQLNREIEKGDTYPMIESLTIQGFGKYWFQNFTAIMIMGEVDSLESLAEMEQSGADWEKMCLGSFYIKPNYPGRSSHICNGAFLVTDAARNKGVGRLMGEGYLEWAPRLGYSYSVFNLVYETNVASCRIWDALGFKRIGRVKGAGALRSNSEELVDAIIYGRDLGPEGEDFVSEERFDKIRYYLKHSKYPAGADRAEKSRLRSAATHYKLIPSPDGAEERLMLKDKEVVSDPQRQYEIARQLHTTTHGGINKTTASIAERYHWVRIKETVSLVIKNCPECKESSKAQLSRPDGQVGTSASGNGRKSQNNNAGSQANHDPNRDIERLVNLDQPNIATDPYPVNTEPAPARRSRRSIAKTETPMIPDTVQYENAHIDTSRLDNTHLDHASSDPTHIHAIAPHSSLHHSRQPGAPPPQQPGTIQQHPIPQQQYQYHQQEPHQQQHQQHSQRASMVQMHNPGATGYDEMPLDPQIMTYNPHMSSEAMAHALESQHLSSHQGLGGQHDLSGVGGMNNVGLPHGLSNGLPDGMGSVDSGMNHSVDQSMQHAVDTGMGHNVDQSMQHQVDQGMGHNQMHVNMMGMSQNGFGLGMGGQHHSQAAMGMGADDRMDEGAEVDGRMDHHLMEAGFGAGVGHGGS